jgi:dienelactone hydrolase
MPLRAALQRALISVLTIVAGVALGVPALLWWRQDSLLFHPPDAPAVMPTAVGRTVERVQVLVAEGVTLSGWLARPAGAADTRLPLVLYFGGNAEEVSWMAEMSARFPGWALLAVNYRGYGGNPGQPGETALVADATRIHDWAAARPDVDPARIAVIGRRLGSGVAVQLATARRLAGVVLVTPYDSVADVAKRIYRFIPVDLLLRHRFDSRGRAGSITTPMLTLAAANDTLIPPAHARRLFEAWAGPKQWQLIARADHNSIDADPAFWSSIAAFLGAR